MEIHIETKLKATRFELVTGRIENETVVKPMFAGVALSYPEESHYVLRLSMFPKQFYYLNKNHENQTHYTIFSRRVLDPNDPKKVHFQNPVGMARLTQNLKSHLEVKFSLFDTTLFMNLYPME